MLNWFKSEDRINSGIIRFCDFRFLNDVLACGVV